MIKLSVSQAARKLGVSRAQIQVQINSGKLQTHEGYVTTDSIRLAYPKINLHLEQDKHIQKMQQIKANAMFKTCAADTVKQENEQMLISIITSLKSKLYKEELKNEHYVMVFEELDSRLYVLEKCCHAQDKEPLHKLQYWIRNQSSLN
ncbi:hypothetical protein Rmag_0852 [Candidatus Ruthia magnifica str. Cm (Calyptogena magnifica)]|uniref:Uncharacterized protein n=1 Tax=Ruthia magnifica subsp. Calyptogena magnifica TaxID=413404 RepID=A1AXB2_RUTMC|nr:hypothetical protein [Candidatus Ruthturnera calyptogenae]ABL02569.1 hypothetical protein Rmag_0852 [Candidatus Ruthia magnifica str. Cm (Calyptogena magnifica)]